VLAAAQVPQSLDRPADPLQTHVLSEVRDDAQPSPATRRRKRPALAGSGRDCGPPRFLTAPDCY